MKGHRHKRGKMEPLLSSEGLAPPEAALGGSELLGWRYAGGEFLAATLKNTSKLQLWVEREKWTILGVSPTGGQSEGYGPRGQVTDDSRLR